MNVAEYLDSINKRYKQGITTEHSFRGDLQTLIESLIPGVYATNEPKRQKCGAPDYILTRNEIPVGFIEAKDIGDGDLQGKNKSGNKEQFDRYRESLTNLIFTDYLDFHFYKDGKPTQSVRIAEITDKAGKREIKPIPEAFSTFEQLIRDFGLQVTQTIKSSKTLAEMMAAKARLLANVIEQALNSDEETSENSTLKDQLHAFKEILIHDITPKAFADVYAQTIAYGMFAARLHDPTLPTFSRQEAAELIPKSNPFLRKLFSYIAGVDIDDRIKWIVDSLVEVFLACNVEELLKNYGKSTKTEDPIIHFYETFLSEYDPKLRKARGVWYTPAPVVNFIVRAVDEVLKTEFNLPNGLADTSKTKVKVNLQETDKRYKENIKTVEQEVHKVQILDPATGTGTFLAEVVKQIHKKFEGQQGIWSNYVETHLLPRLNGFELLMASYAMAHLQLDLLFTETGFKPTKNQRLRVYLTNSLEESHPDTGTLFANWLSAEANEANKIKRDTPVMCIIGNPPYSGESANKGEWIMKLMEDYKKEPGGNEKLKEKNSKFINDDYVKFLRYGQFFIEKNGSGILAFINPHGYLDNPTYRGMRWNLLKTYDKIYTIDLHGNAKKKETAPDGSADINVFDIEQGVSINLLIKTGKKKENELGEVFHFDLFGKREVKYDYLFNNGFNDVKFKKLKNQTPYYFFRPKDFEDEKVYNEGFSILELFPENSLGVLSKNDEITISYDKLQLEQRISDLTSLEENEIKIKYKVKNDSRDWILSKAIKDLKENSNKDNYRKINYRPFDFRWTYFTGKTKGFFAYSQNRIMRNFVQQNNFALISGRQGQAVGNMQWNLSFISNIISDQNIYYRGGGTVFPLYIYNTENTKHLFKEENERKPNLSESIITSIAKKINLTFIQEKEPRKNTFAPIDILDYIYSVLHSPTYREKYKEFLKIDFPRVPYPKDKETFWKLVKLGGELREIHLLESPKVEKYITQYPVDGDNVVNKPVYKNGRVYINETQYFDNVPATAWEFYIGGYQPAQKWLKDRKERKLEFDDILHYQKIIVALSETARIMKEIDKIDFE
ncbi:MAG: DNA methyltransferase [Bacteroidia bacterium]|jgi:predicted helicase|nr:DNA methyltransferase [Bacteroidia bacterium]